MEELRAVLVVDAEGFSRNRDVDLPRLHMAIRRAVERACAASGLGEVWDSLRFVESTGDGLLAIFPHSAASALIDPFPLRLQEQLAQAASSLGRLRLRLRLALHIGLIDDERAEAPGISTAVIDTCRLVNAEPLR